MVEDPGNYFDYPERNLLDCP